MTTSWILVANASQAQLYQSPRAKLLNGHPHLSLLEQFSHPQSRQKLSEMVSDKSGHSGRRGTYEQSVSPKLQQADLFAKELVDHLQQARHSHLFDDLILIAPASFQGLLKKHAHGVLETCVSANIEKDFTRSNQEQLGKRLGNYL